MRIAAISVLVISGFLPARDARGQAVSVSVRDSAGKPVAQVALTLIDTGGRAIATARTGVTGVAHMPRAVPGRYAVFARRLGFRPQRTDYWSLGESDTVAVRLMLDPAPISLDPIVVQAERDLLRASTVFGFNLRASGGVIVTPSEIEQAILGARDVADILARQSIAGMRIDQVQRCLVSSRATRLGRVAE